MADNVAITAGSGTTVAADEVVDGTLGTVKVQYTKLMSGVLDETGKVGASVKGTQTGGSAMAVQDFKDAGRVPVVLTVDEYQVAATADTQITTMASTAAFAAPTTSLSSYPVTTAKRYRAQFLSIQATTTTGNTTAIKFYVRARANPAGAAVNTSPVWFESVLLSSATATGAGTQVLVPLPEGLEFAAGTGIGFSVQAPAYVVTVAAPLVTITLIGFEY